MFNPLFLLALCSSLALLLAAARWRFSYRAPWWIWWALAICLLVCLLDASFQLEKRNRANTVGWMSIVATNLFLIVAVFFVRRGRRATKLDDHPYCRKCGFDQFGKSEASTRCSECGTDLSNAKKSIRFGRYQSNGWMILCGGILLLLCLLIDSAMIRESIDFSHFNINHYKPAWYLLRELNSNSARSNAAVELGRRLRSNPADDSLFQKVLAKVLQDGAADRKSPLYWDVLVLLEKGRHVDETTTRQLLRLYPLHFFFVGTARQAVAQRPMLYTVVLSGVYGVNRSLEIEEIRLGNQLISPLCYSKPTTTAFSPADEGWSELDLQKNETLIPLGQTTLSVRARIKLQLSVGGQTIREEMPYTDSAPTTIVSPDEVRLSTTRPSSSFSPSDYVALINPDGLMFFGSLAKSGSTEHILARCVVHPKFGPTLEIPLVEIQRGARFSTKTLYHQMQIPDQVDRIELIPAPEASVDARDRSPICDQTITITNIQDRRTAK